MTKSVSIVFGLFVLVSMAAPGVHGKTATVTGIVGDAMCGATHMMEGDAAGCTRACVKKGSSYALIAGKTVYELKTDSAQTKAALDKLAGKKATVTGDQNGETIQVVAVAAAK